MRRGTSVQFNGFSCWSVEGTSSLRSGRGAKSFAFPVTSLLIMAIHDAMYQIPWLDQCQDQGQVFLLTRLRLDKYNYR